MAFATILVTGAGGFVGQHLLTALRAKFTGSRIIGTGMGAGCDEALDITRRDEVDSAFRRLQPDVCIHLAAISAIGAAKADPDQAWAVNLHGSLNIARAILTHAPHCRMIFISSSECYGASFKSGLALDETAPLAPLNLYAATKAAAEMALCGLAGEGLRLLRLRPFNHTGPGQREDFVVPAFAGQIARIEAGLAPPEILVGALEPEREFLDVRDVCAAYAMAVEKFDKIPNNAIINISHGQAVTISLLLEMLLGLAQISVSVRRDPARLRAAEIVKAAGNASKAKTLLGWIPQVELAATLASVLDYARQNVSGLILGSQKGI